MKILIVGAGIGGLTLSAYLQKYGIKPTIIEKAKKWKTIGYILALYPNGMKILKEIGADELVKKKGFVISKQLTLNKDGKKLCEMDFVGQENKHGPMYEIERDLVHKSLRNVNRNIDVRMGTTIKSIRQNKNHVEIIFNNGKRENYDVVVGADGINSQIRKLIDPREDKINYSGVTFWMFWLPRKKDFPKTVTYQFGNGKLFTMFPCKSKKKVEAFFTIPAKEHSFGNSSESVEDIKDLFKDMSGLTKVVIKNLKSQKPQIYHHDDDEVHAKNWYAGRVVMIGDSVHALSPVLGIGASMAMEDASVLADEISKFQLGKLSDENVRNIFERYYMRRFKRIDFLATKSKQMHLLIKYDGPLIFLRDILLKYMCRKFLRDIDNFLSEKI